MIFITEKKWKEKTIKSFATEKYLVDALENDRDYDGLTYTINKLIILMLDDDNNAVQQFKKEHPEYK